MVRKTDRFWRRIPCATLMAVGATMAISACGASTDSTNSTDSTGATGATTEEVAEGSVALREWSFVFPGGETIGSYPPGSTTLTLINRGTIEHQLLVVQTNLSRFELPLKPDGLLDTTAPGLSILGDAKLAPAESATFSSDLPAGKYLFVCNIDGHLSKGMVASVVVG